LYPVPAPGNFWYSASARAATPSGYLTRCRRRPRAEAFFPAVNCPQTLNSRPLLPARSLPRSPRPFFHDPVHRQSQAGSPPKSPCRGRVSLRERFLKRSSTCCGSTHPVSLTLKAHRHDPCVSLLGRFNPQAQRPILGALDSVAERFISTSEPKRDSPISRRVCSGAMDACT